jgi:hypothetical protein
MSAPQADLAGAGQAGTIAGSHWHSVLLGAVAALAVFGTVVFVVAAFGATVAQLTAVVATANADSMARHASAHPSTSCGLASR